MITLFSSSFNPVSQKNYDNTLASLQFHQLTCSCGHSGCLTRHGYYFRSFKSALKKVVLRICRVKCSICGTTHAILPADMVPYSQIPLSIQIHVVLQHHNQAGDFQDIMHSFPEIDEGNILYILRQYRLYWKQRLLSEDLQPACSASFLSRCFSRFNRQFMQIKNTKNILFPLPT